MIIYLAGFKTIEKIWSTPTNGIYLLSSFWEFRNGRYPEYVLQDKHILDSGAFTAINDKTGKYKNFDWDLYVKKYIQFIKETKQKQFFELDIDCVVGLPKVEQYRKQIEDAIGIPPIVCWHANRGADYWIKSCEEYKYVALGTTRASETGKKIRRDPTILQWFINHAHNNKAKIHGLGFTSAKWLSKLKFDSVDSTTWNVGGKYGNLTKINYDATHNRITAARWYNYQIMQKKDKKYRIDVNAANVHNFKQWIKIQQFAENNW